MQNSHLEQFLSDISIPGLITQVGSENTVIDTFDGKESVKNLLVRFEALTTICDQNMYFLGGVRKDRGKDRAADTDIDQKNYVYFDFDIRKAQPELTDAEIKDIGKWLIDVLSTDSLLSQWRYIVFTGNGLHLYYFADQPLLILDQKKWKMGHRVILRKLEELTGMELDASCTNIARIARLPGSQNFKSNPPKDVEILHHQASHCQWLSQLEGLGEAETTKIEEENRLKAQKMTTMFPLMTDTYKAIQAIPIDNVVTRLFGWESDGKHFFEPGSRKKSACFVAENENYLVHGGTSHIPSSQVGFRPFELVKEVKKLENSSVFQWFKDQYPEVREISNKEKSDKEKQVQQQIAGRGDIASVFGELQNSKFEQLMFDPQFDSMKFIIRGAVTRIGAFSNIGKSKLAYFLARGLLKSGHRGILFSTEVPRHIVLTNLLSIVTGYHFWDILEKKVDIPKAALDQFANLEIYDVSQTKNNLTTYEALVQRSIDEGGKRPDFVMIDFCQGVTPSARSDGEYMQMSRYAFEVQSMAQRLNISVIDLSQISNEGVKDEFNKIGFIPFKGSGHLYSSADIGILLKRENKDNPDDKSMVFDIRKHKYLPPKREMLECDFSNGTFKVFGSEFERAPVVYSAISSMPISVN